MYTISDVSNDSHFAPSMSATNENSMFYEFSSDCATRAQALCDKLKLRCDQQSYNPYEWMFTSEKTHFSGPYYDAFLIQKSKTDNAMSIDEQCTLSVSDDRNDTALKGIQEQSPQSVEHCIARDELSRLGHIQVALHACSVESETVADAIELINVTPLMQMHEVCEQLSLADLNENNLTVVLEALMKQGLALSYAASSVVLQHLFKSKVVNLQQSASRVFTVMVTSTAKQFPQRMIEAVLIPAVQETTFGAPQCDLMCRVVKESVEPEHVKLFLSQLLLLTEAWSDVLIPLIQTIIDLKVPMDQAILTSLMKKYAAESQNLKSSLKFSKLLQSTVNKYGPHFTGEDISYMRQALTENQTFLRKSIENSLQKFT